MRYLPSRRMKRGWVGPDWGRFGGPNHLWARVLQNLYQGWHVPPGSITSMESSAGAMRSFWRSEAMSIRSNRIRITLLSAWGICAAALLCPAPTQGQEEKKLVEPVYRTARETPDEKPAAQVASRIVGDRTSVVREPLLRWWSCWWSLRSSVSWSLCCCPP